MSKREGFCRWYDKNLRDVSEHEQEKCYIETGQECINCPEVECREVKEDNT